MATPDTSKPQMDLTKDQEYEIYVAYKHVFNGSYKCYRKPSYVKGHIDNPRAYPVAAAVLEKYGRGTVIRVVLALLQAKVFKNEKYAKERFSTTESLPSLPPTPELDASEPSEVVQPPLDLEQKDDTSTNIDPPPIVSEGPIEVIEPVKVEQESDVQVSQVADESSAKEETPLNTTSSPVKTTEAKVPTSRPDISDDVRILSRELKDSMGPVFQALCSHKPRSSSIICQFPEEERHSSCVNRVNPGQATFHNTTPRPEAYANYLGARML